MKKLMFCILLAQLIGDVNLYSQKQDYIWLGGFGSEYGYDSTWQHFFGVTRFDFNNNTLNVTRDSLGMGFTSTNVSYCDTNGELLFYSNGTSIRNSFDELLYRSDSMNIGVFRDYLVGGAKEVGLTLDQGIIAIEDPAKANAYYLVHSYVDTVVNEPYHCRAIKYTYLDMNANAGFGEVGVLNQTIVNGSYGYNLKACRHANGRDWWLLVQKKNTNCYERILIDDKGIHTLEPTCTGTLLEGLGMGSSCFSPDGSKFVFLRHNTGAHLYSFDRCTGAVSNEHYLPIPLFMDSGSYISGTAFSPNNRFLYVNATIHCYQYDLWANDIKASIDTVAFFDGSQNPFNSTFYTMQLGADGKIYSGCGNGEYVYHVIDNPDVKGDSCNFRQHSIQLPTFGGTSTPNFPNYRLGALAGSGCDTLTAINDIAEKEKQLKIYPNPATEYVVIDYGFTDWSKGEVALQITNAAGSQVHAQALPQYSGFQKINVSAWAAGSYVVSIKRGGKEVAVGRFTKL